jgi:2-haloacid dehalogenase/putative hydrolase of the HAD superfamily
LPRKSRTRAVFFDLGGTLYDYNTLDPGNREALVNLARWAGVAAPEKEILESHRSALREVFNRYLPKPFYLHRNLFRDVLLGMAKRLQVSLNEELLARYRELQRRNQERDFRLREGALEMLSSLKGEHLHLAIVSNIDEDQLHQLVELGKLDEVFDDLLSSEAACACKPNPAIFEEALRRAGCRAEEALFVGDSVRQDIEGANRVGIPSVLLWHRDDRSPPDGEPRPRHVIHRIGEVGEIVGR